MSSKEVTLLRKTGRLDEALKMALWDLKQERNEWTLSALFWVLREFAEKAIEQNDQEAVAKRIHQMEEVLEKMRDSENIATRTLESIRKKADPYGQQVQIENERSKTDQYKSAYENIKKLFDENKLAPIHFETYGWIIYRYLSKDLERLDSASARQLLFDYIKLDITTGSKTHSAFIQLAAKAADLFPDFKLLPFIKLWGTDKFTWEDTLEQSVGDKNYSSLIDRLLKKLFSSGKYTIEEIVEVFENVYSLGKKYIIRLFQESYYWDIRNAKGNDMFRLFENYTTRFNEHPASEFQSKIIESACWNMKDDNEWRFPPFILKFTTVDFQSNDFLPVEKEEKTYDSLVTKCIGKMYDYILKNLDHVRADDFIDLIKMQLKYTPDQPQLMRKLAILLSKTGRSQEASDTFRELLLKLNEWYVWHDVAKTIENDNALKMAFLAKALLMQRNEDFLGEVHLEMAECMLHDGLKPFAAKELAIYKETRLRNNWKIEDRYQALSKQVENIQENPDNRKYYLSIAENAETYAYSHISPERMALVSCFKNAEGKPRLKFVNADGTKTTSFSANKFTQLRHIKPGQILDIRMDGKDVLCASLVNEMPWSIFPREVGRVEYINLAKKIIHIALPDGNTCFYGYEESKLQKDDFVQFIAVSEEVKGEKRINPINIKKLSSDKAIPAFPEAVVLVDHINTEKALFRFVVKRGLTGIVHFKDTALRPQMGEFLNIHYYIVKGKEGKTFVKILTMQPTNERNPDLMKTTTGYLELKWKGNNTFLTPDFGFVNDYYVGKLLLLKNNITEDCSITATILFNGEKWQVSEISKNE